MDGMKCLFDPDKPHFAAWLWVYNEEPTLTHTTYPRKPDAVPLYYAALFGLYDLAVYLLAEHPKDVYAEGGLERTPLHASITHGHFDISSLLIEHVRNPNIRGRFHWTLLHKIMSSTVQSGDIEFARRLLDRGADVNAQGAFRWSPLYLAAWEGRLDFAQLLLEHGAAINALTNGDETPLHKASAMGHVDLVRLLLEHGADPNLSDKYGRTPFDLASGREIVELLSEYGAKPMPVVV
jgi:ankyrin repeat protein